MLAPPFAFPIERGKILEFARAIHSEISLRFLEPVLLGDTITCRVEPTPGDASLLDLACLRGSGEIATSGSARLG